MKKLPENNVINLLGENSSLGQSSSKIIREPAIWRMRHSARRFRVNSTTKSVGTDLLSTAGYPQMGQYVAMRRRANFRRFASILLGYEHKNLPKRPDFRIGTQINND